MKFIYCIPLHKRIHTHGFLLLLCVYIGLYILYIYILCGGWGRFYCVKLIWKIHLAGNKIVFFSLHDIRNSHNHNHKCIRWWIIFYGAAIKILTEPTKQKKSRKATELPSTTNNTIEFHNKWENWIEASIKLNYHTKYGIRKKWRKKSDVLYWIHLLRTQNVCTITNGKKITVINNHFDNWWTPVDYQFSFWRNVHTKWIIRKRIEENKKLVNN